MFANRPKIVPHCIALSLLALFGLQSSASAGQWNDIIGASNTLPTTTDLYIQTDSVHCTPTPGPAATLNTGIGGATCPFTAFNLVAVNLLEFARQRDLLATQAGLSAAEGQIAALETSITDLSAQSNALAVALREQGRISDTGVAQALAMAGTADLQSDENYAIGFNFGTFHGRNAIAVGGAARLSDHVSFNAGASGGFGASAFGARAGFRIGW